MAFLWVVIDLPAQKTLGLHPFLIHLVGRLCGSVSRVDILEPGIIGLLVHQIGAHELKGVGRRIAFGALPVLIVPDRTFEGSVHCDERVVLVEHDAHDRSRMVVEKLSELVNLHILRYLSWFKLYCVLFLQGERRLLLLLNLGKHRNVKRQVGLRVIYSVHIEIVFQELALLEAQHHTASQPQDCVDGKYLG